LNIVRREPVVHLHFGKTVRKTPGIERILKGTTRR
jgi:hypothetical protein